MKEFIPDFIFKPLSLALEVKISKDSTRPARLVDEINADIAAYSVSYESIIFVVYDLGTIRDEVQFRSDLEAAAGVHVVVVKH